MYISLYLAIILLQQDGANGGGYVVDDRIRCGSSGVYGRNAITRGSCVCMTTSRIFEKEGGSPAGPGLFRLLRTVRSDDRLHVSLHMEG